MITIQPPIRTIPLPHNLSIPTLNINQDQLLPILYPILRAEDDALMLLRNPGNLGNNQIIRSIGLKVNLPRGRRVVDLEQVECNGGVFLSNLRILNMEIFRIRRGNPLSGHVVWHGICWYLRLPGLVRPMHQFSRKMGEKHTPVSSNLKNARYSPSGENHNVGPSEKISSSPHKKKGENRHSTFPLKLWGGGTNPLHRPNPVPR